ncbi:MAG TPA: hypothetical protein VM598_12165 [Bdellovibrionota bacterium]|jgi:hypothetical protein|nr:hypothetical protein [Bdellovibrionota bacterium]
MPRTSSAPQGAVGKEALSYCTSCKMDLNHTIVALKGDRIAKVHCLTCKKEHVYRAPKGITEPGQVPKKATRTRKKKEEVAEAVSVEAEWEKLMAAHREAPLKPYSTKSNFALGDKLSHPTFGDGIVGKLIYPNKLEVIFRTDVKVLIHGGAQAV